MQCLCQYSVPTTVPSLVSMRPVYRAVDDTGCLLAPPGAASPLPSDYLEGSSGASLEASPLPSPYCYTAVEGH